MRTLATVVEIKTEDTAIVSVARHAACDGCHKNADGHGCSVCTLLGGKTEARATALNTVGAAVGDTVEIASRTGRILAYGALVFLAPVLLALLGYFLGKHFLGIEGAALGMAGGAFLLAFLGIWLFSRCVIAHRLDVEIVQVIRSQSKGEEVPPLKG